MDEQKLVDLVAQRIGCVVFDFFLQLLAAQSLAAETALEIALLRFELSPRNDVAIYFGGNLLDYTDVRCDRQCIVHTLGAIDGDIAADLGQRQRDGPSNAPRTTRH